MKIEIDATSTKGTYQFSMFKLELKFGCSFSFFRCFVVNIDSCGMDKKGKPWNHERPSINQIDLLFEFYLHVNILWPSIWPLEKRRIN